MKMYHQEFTSHAVKLIRQQQAIMTTLCENYSIETNDDSFMFTHKSKSIEEMPIVTTSRPSGQYQCDCRFYSQNHLVCAHILIIISAMYDQFMPDTRFSLEEIVSIKQMYLRKDFDVEQYQFQATYVVEEPLVTQAIKSTQNMLNANQKYHRNLESFQRFNARTAQIGADQYDKMIRLWDLITESSEQNNLDNVFSEIIKKHCVNNHEEFSTGCFY